MLSAHISVDPGLHGTTFGGNPLACAAALAAMETFQSQKLAQRAEELCSYFESRFAEKQLSQVRTVRRLGLMIGIEIKHRAQDALAFLLERKIIALPAGPNVIRLLPPLVIEKSQLDRVVEALHECLA